jgi:hypothetical protein
MKRKAKARDLTAIVAELHALDGREIVEIIIKRGQLLREIRDQLDHGEWLPWLKRECDFSESSARNYMKASEFAERLAEEKSATVADLHLTPSALYYLADECFNFDDALDAVLDVARKERVDCNRAEEIAAKVWAEQAAIEDAKRQAAEAKRIKWEAANPEKAKAKARDEAIAFAMEEDREEAKQEARDDGEAWGDIKDEWAEKWIAENWGAEQEAEFETEWKEQWARDHGPAPEPKPETEAAGAASDDDDSDSILDGPPPELPPAEPAPAVDFVLPAFEQAIKQLKELQTKPLHKFVVTYHSADDIAAVADFLSQVATAKKAKAAA